MQTKQNKTKQNKTKQNKTKQNKTKQNKTKTKQNNALCNSNSGLGYKLAFYRYRYNITMSDDFDLCIARISQLAIVNNFHEFVNFCT